MTLIDVKTCIRESEKGKQTGKELYFKMKLGNILFICSANFVFNFCNCKPVGSDIEAQLQQVNFNSFIC